MDANGGMEEDGEEEILVVGECQGAVVVNRGARRRRRSGGGLGRRLEMRVEAMRVVVKVRFLSLGIRCA